MTVDEGTDDETDECPLPAPKKKAKNKAHTSPSKGPDRKNENENGHHLLFSGCRMLDPTFLADGRAERGVPVCPELRRNLVQITHSAPEGGEG